MFRNTVSTSQRARRTASVHVRLRDKDTVAVEDKRLSNLQRDRERNLSEERDYSHLNYLSCVTETSLLPIPEPETQSGETVGRRGQGDTAELY